jgi:Tol biopolymer transport system component
MNSSLPEAHFVVITFESGKKLQTVKPTMKLHSMKTRWKKMFFIFFILVFQLASFSTPLAAQDKNKKEDKKEDKKKIVEPFVVKRLTQNISLYSLGQISPDKKSLAFVAARQGTSPNLFLMNLEDFSISAPLTNLKWGATEPQWSPDSSKIAFAGFGDTGNFADIYITDLKSGGLRKLTANNFSDKEPVFTPDGKRLLFTTDESPLPEAAFGILHIASVAVTGGKAEYFTDDEISSIRPMIALDGKSMYLVKVEEQSGRHSLWQYDFKGKAIRDLTEDRFARIHKVVFNPTNNTAILWAQRQAEQQDNIYIMDLKSGEVKDLPEPDLPKSNFALSPNGNLIAFVGAAEVGAQLYLFDSVTGTIQQLTFRGSNVYTPIFITDEQIIFGSNRDAWVKETTKQVSKTQGVVTEEIQNDKEIYLLNLTQKSEEEKKKK